MRDGEYVPPGANPFGGAIGGLAAALEPVNDASAPLTGGGDGGRPVPVGAGGPEGSPMHLPATQSKVMLFHVLFKAIALVIYLLSGMIFNTNEGGGYVMTFVIVTILSALDFWTVKNVSGRLLVGLRWWNRVDDKGESHWQFESFEDRRFVHPTDSNVFWMTLFGAPLVWALLGIGSIITLHFMWLLLCLVALGLCGINLYGYIRCKKDARTKLTALGGTVLSRGMEMWSGANARARGQQGGL